MTWSGFFKSVSVVLVAIALVVGGGVIAFQYFLTQLTALPPKPIFPNDKPLPTAKNTVSTSTKPAIASPTPKPAPSDSPSPTAKPTPYQARITLDNGLNVRDNPSADGSRIGGVDYDQVVTVLETSPDQEWQRIRVDASGVEGWIKSGHTDRVNPTPSEQPETSPTPQTAPAQ